MRALSRKLLRDLRRLAGQMASIAAVAACGIAAMISLRGNYDSLVRSRDEYYDRQRFADVFVRLRRAPDAVARAVAALPGVAAVEPRIAGFVLLDVPGFPEPVSGELLSLPADPAHGVNAVYLRQGRFPAPGRADEVMVSEVFATAHRFVPGDSMAAIINGRWQALRIVGIGLSPEFIYEVGPGQIFPDNERFGVVWMRRDALAPALDLEGSFNDLALTLTPGGSEPETIAAVDRLLAPWGGTGSYGRADQISYSFLRDELVQHRVTGDVIGYLFLGVAAFLVNLVLARLIAAQREQIGTLKAFGYGNVPLAAHYLLMGLAPVLAGLVAGSLLGIGLGRLFTDLFGRYYHFPSLHYVAAPGTLLLAAAVSVVAATAGALQALRSVIRLPPAEAMRPEAPARFRRGLLDRLGIAKLGFSIRMAARYVTRRPVKSALSIAGIAFATALLVLGRFFTDAMTFMADVEFRVTQQQDAIVTFREVMPSSAVTELRRLPGVVTAEPFRVVAVELRHGARRVRTSVLGIEPGSHLRRLVSSRLVAAELPADGLLINHRLADRLAVQAGELIEVQPLEGERLPRQVRVGAVFDELMGNAGYARLDDLSRLLREGHVVSGALLGTDGTADEALAAALKQLPAVAGVGFKKGLVASFERTLAESMGISTLFLTGFACVIAMAVVYNGLRIAFSERARELASLRVLGFERGEVATILIGEQAALTAVALPAGCLLGWLLCAATAKLFVTDLFRIPLVVPASSYLLAAGVILAATLAAALLILRRVDRLDLVEALKTRE
ncbi:MAG: transporter, permease protein [Gemmatimonadetes bacterium]|nr:transporter, permease protein [Gemmatimonadota bacterium]